MKYTQIYIQKEFLMRTHVSLISCTFSKCNVFENGRTYIYIYIYIFIVSLQVDFRVEQCSIR